MVIDRIPGSEIENYFSDELSPYLMLLFKDGAMRTATNTKLNKFLLKDVSPSEPLPDIFRTVRTEDAFLWRFK